MGWDGSGTCQDLGSVDFGRSLPREDMAYLQLWTLGLNQFRLTTRVIPVLVQQNKEMTLVENHGQFDRQRLCSRVGRVQRRGRT